MLNVRRLTVAVCLLAPPVAYAQDPLPDPPAGGGRGGRAQEPEIRPYDRVITTDAKTDEGIFAVHRIKDRLYYEIPKDRLGREFLWVSQIAKTTLGAGYGGQAAGNRVVKWERRGDRILLRAVSYDVVADPNDDARAFFRGELRTLDRDLESASSRQQDRATLLHLQDIRMEIARALDPAVKVAAAAGVGTTALDDSLFDVTSMSDLCWQDYIVTRTKQ